MKYTTYDCWSNIHLEFCIKQRTEGWRFNSLIEHPSRWFNYVKRSPEWQEGKDYYKTTLGWMYSIEKVKREIYLSALENRQRTIKNLKAEAEETEKEIKKIKRQLSKKTTQLNKKMAEVEKYYESLAKLPENIL